MKKKFSIFILAIATLLPTLGYAQTYQTAIITDNFVSDNTWSFCVDPHGYNANGLIAGSHFDYFVGSVDTDTHRPVTVTPLGDIDQCSKQVDVAGNGYLWLVYGGEASTCSISPVATNLSDCVADGSVLIAKYAIRADGTLDWNNLYYGVNFQGTGCCSGISYPSPMYMKELKDLSPTNKVAWVATAYAAQTEMAGIQLSPQSTLNWGIAQILLVLGSSFGILEKLMPYIIGLIVIGLIVYFVYRAFRFVRT